MEVVFGLFVLYLLYAIANVIDDLRGEIQRIREHMESETAASRRTGRAPGRSAGADT